MGIEVPVHTGGEMLAKKYDMNVIFLKTKKLKRGYYEGSFEILCDENARYAGSCPARDGAAVVATIDAASAAGAAA